MRKKDTVSAAIEEALYTLNTEGGKKEAIWWLERAIEKLKEEINASA
jgi:hypothetical protein